MKFAAVAHRPTAYPPSTSRNSRPSQTSTFSKQTIPSSPLKKAACPASSTTATSCRSTGRRRAFGPDWERKRWPANSPAPNWNGGRPSKPPGPPGRPGIPNARCSTRTLANAATTSTCPTEATSPAGAPCSPTNATATNSNRRPGSPESVSPPQVLLLPLSRRFCGSRQGPRPGIQSGCENLRKTSRLRHGSRRSLRAGPSPAPRSRRLHHRPRGPYPLPLFYPDYKERLSGEKLLEAARADKL